MFGRTKKDDKMKNLPKYSFRNFVTDWTNEHEGISIFIFVLFCALLITADITFFLNMPVVAAGVNATIILVLVLRHFYRSYKRYKDRFVKANQLANDLVNNEEVAAWGNAEDNNGW